MGETGGEHGFTEHTGEVRLEVAASSREELFAEAGRALAELMLGEPREPALDPAPEHAVEVRAGDRAALLVEWLNELIYLSEIHKQVFTRFRVEHVDEKRVRAVVAGVSPETLQTAVKAATLHGVSVELRDGRWRASVVLDV
jgi:SHS2 domain-containing protein